MAEPGLPLGPLGHGAANVGNLYRAMTDEEAWAILDAAWESGVRYFDTAPHYGLGLAEQRLAEGLEGRARDEFIVSTKVGRRLALTSSHAMDDEGFAVPATHVRVRDYSRDGVLASLES